MHFKIQLNSLGLPSFDTIKKLKNSDIVILK